MKTYQTQKDLTPIESVNRIPRPVNPNTVVIAYGVLMPSEEHRRLRQSTTYRRYCQPIPSDYGRKLSTMSAVLMKCRGTNFERKLAQILNAGDVQDSAE